MAIDTTAGMGAAAAEAPSLDHRFKVVPAAISDVAALEQVEREAFPEQWPPTRFEGEIRKSNALYLMAVAANRAGAPPSGPAQPNGAEAGPEPRSRNSLATLIRGATRLRSALRRQAPPPTVPASYVAGFVGMWFVVDETHIVSIGVRRLERRRGVGELLLLGAFDSARARRMETMTLEVRRSNTGAQALYAKYGFKEAGVRKRYYVDNGEDAIIMTTPSINTPEFLERLEQLRGEHARRRGRAA